MQMDAVYEKQCSHVGVPPHPRLLRDFAAFEARRAAGVGLKQQEVLFLGGVRSGGSKDVPIRDADVVPVCLVVQTLARAAAPPPPVHLDFSGELITCEGAKTLAAVLQVNCGVRAVSLRRTGVSDEGVAALGAALGGSSVVELDLGECRISNAGARHLARGVQLHGAPSSLKVLLLDGNPMGDAGVVEIISLIEGPLRPPALTTLSVQPAAPRALSEEVEAALHVVCDLCRVELRGEAEARGAPAVGRPGWTAHEPSLSRSLHVDDEPSSSSLGLLLHDRHVSEARTPPPQWSAAVAEPPPRGCVGRVLHRQAQCSSPSPASQWWSSVHATPARAPSPLTTPDVRAGRSSGHLAAWMAGTERELRELKWLLGASAARLDGQHARLMGELDKLRGQLDMWARAGSANGVPGGDEGRLEVLEARFDALEQLVGREQSECAQMWQLVEVAAGAAPASAPAPTPPAVVVQGIAGAAGTGL